MFVYKQKLGTPAEREGNVPGPHPVRTCHFQGRKKTQSAVSGGVLLLFSISPAPSQRKGKEENYRECGVRKQSAVGLRVLIEGQSLRVSMEKDPRRQGQGQTGFRNQELESDTPTLPWGRLMTPASLSSD